MVNNQDETTLKSAVYNLCKTCEELTAKMDNVVTAQEKVNGSLREYAEAKRTGTPVQYMEEEQVEKIIERKLRSGLAASAIKVDVKDPVASIDARSSAKIESLICTTTLLLERVQNILPKRPLMNFTIQDGKKHFKAGVVIAGLFLLGMIWAYFWAAIKVNSFKNQDFFWAYRAYQAILSDDDQPGNVYHSVMLDFKDEPEKAKASVELLENKAADYQKWKQYLLSFIGGKDIRVIKWETDYDEGWLLYRFYDEETERSVHVWPDGKIEETTNKIVTDLASAQKYSKRKIWTVIREAQKL